MNTAITVVEAGTAFAVGWAGRSWIRRRHRHVWEILDVSGEDHYRWVKQRCQLCGTEEVKKV